MKEIIELLSNAEQADKLMQNLAGYVVYIYPGIITIYLYNFFNAKKTKDTQVFVVRSFAISYLYNILLQVVFPKVCFLKDKVQKDRATYNVVLIAVAAIAPYIAHKFLNSKLFEYICDVLKISTSVTDVPFELIEDKEEQYTCLKVYLRKEPYVYIGFIQEYEYQNETDRFLILSGFRKYIVNEKKHEKLIEAHKIDSYKDKVFIKYADIQRIEKLNLERAKTEVYN